MVRRAAVLLVLALCACGEDEPSAPVPREPIGGIFEYQSGDSDLEGASLWFQSHAPYMFRLTNPQKVDAEGTLSDIQEEGHYWTEDSLLTLDVTRHSPPGYIELYALAPGENVFAYALQGSCLTLLGKDWHSGDSWTTEWIATDTTPSDGDYQPRSSCAPHLDSLRGGAVLALDPSVSSAPASPVEEAGLSGVETGTCETTQQATTLYIATRNPPRPAGLGHV